ncbi:inorganic diphosphatase [Candidatus Woesearchaeota archaeon]|nr:inorganic diphosphatase [Candidatus Woesearchaeota archaeon]
MDLWHDLKPGSTQAVNVIVEIPRGSQNKYEYDKVNKVFKLDRVLFSPLHYPGDYGFIPRTLGEDDDPMDALVLVSHHTFPGVLIQSRPIGLLRMIDSGKRDDKILCVPSYDIRYHHVKDVKQLSKAALNEISHFFQVYKQLEKKDVKIVGWKGREDAVKSLKKSVERYKKKYCNENKGKRR